MRLDRAEAHHARHVLRLPIGAEVTLFDGLGREGAARITAYDRDGAALETGEVSLVDREAAIRLTLGIALPKGKRAEWLFEKCTELGVHAFLPLACRHSVVDPRVREEAHREKWRRLAIETCKQCGRNRLPDLEPAATLEGALARAGYRFRLLADPAPDAVPVANALSGCRPGDAVLALVGPEGGFAPEESERARAAGVTVVTLGPRRLRVETAAVALAAMAGLLGARD